MGDELFPKRETIMSEVDSHDIVRLAQAANPVEAHIWKQALEDEGIRCEVMGEYLDSSIGDVPGMYPEVWVHREDLAHAQEILREGWEARAKEPENDEDEEEVEA